MKDFPTFKLSLHESDVHSRSRGQVLVIGLCKIVQPCHQSGESKTFGQIAIFLDPQGIKYSVDMNGRHSNNGLVCVIQSQHKTP